MIVTEIDLLQRNVARMTDPAIKGTQLEFLDNRPLDGAGREKKLKEQHRKSGGKELF
jgi:hypothetical protein